MDDVITDGCRPYTAASPVYSVAEYPPTMRVIAGQRCPLCGQAGRYLGEREGTAVRECCGALLSWAWEGEDDYNTFYADVAQFHTGQQIEEGFPPAIERDPDHLRASCCRVDIYRSLIPTPWRSLLDVGAGTGAFVATAAAHVSERICGIELCGDLVAWAQGQGRPLRQGRWQDAAGLWSIITLHDVLEHLTEPLEALKHLRCCLAAGGRLIVEMPEWDSPHARSHGMDWRHIRPRQHIWVPSRQAAESLFARAGLEPLAWYRPKNGEIGKCAWVLGTW